MVGKRIREIRTERGLKLRELARLAGISPSSLARIEGGQVSPNFGTITTLAEALDLDARELLSVDDATRSDTEARGLNSRERQLIGTFRQLDRDHQDLVVQMADRFAAISQPRLFDEDELDSEPERKEQSDAPAHYVQGWDRRTAYDHLHWGHGFGHTAGGQFSKPYQPIQAGDVLWVVFVDNGTLHLIGRLEVAGRKEYGKRPEPWASDGGVIFTQREAEKILGTRDVWPASEHLLARKGTETSFRDVEIPDRMVKRLEFKTGSGAITKVKFGPSGRLSGQAFRSVRLLTPRAAAQFEDLWTSSS